MRLVELLLLCGFWFALARGQRFSLPSVDRDIQRLAEATLHVASRYIATRINTLVLRQHCWFCAQTELDQQRQLVDQLLNELTHHMTVIVYKEQAAAPTWEYTIYVVNEVRAFEQLQLNFTNLFRDREFYILIVLMARLPEVELMQWVGRMCLAALKNRIINVVVMAQLSHDQIRFYAYRLFREHCQPGIHTYESNRFLENGDLQYPQLFPIRFSNLSHCALNVSGHVLPPHFMYRSLNGAALPADGVMVNMQDLFGIDGELLRLLASALKFRIRLKIPMNRTHTYRQDTLSGCFDQLKSGQADLAIGGLSGSDNRRFQFATSDVYHQSHFVFVVRSNRYVGSLGKLMHPFRPFVWLCWLAALVSALICAKCLKWSVPLKHPFENLLAATTGNPMPAHRLPQSSFLRHLLANWLLLTLVLRCAYQAKLFDVLRTMQHESLPKGLGGLLRQNYTLISTEYQDFYPHRMTRLIKGNFSQRYVKLLQAPPDQRLATLSLDNNLAHWQRQHQYERGSRLTHVREPIYLYQLVIYFPKDTVFKFSIDRKIEQLISSGVLSHITRRYLPGSYSRISSNVELVSRITNDMLHGLCRCYVALMASAGFLLLLERFSLHCNWLRRLFGWLE